MSNKIVPSIYRQIIDDVIANIRVDFEEYGMEDEVLIDLQGKWEQKLLESKVADFARAPNGESGETDDDDEEEDDSPEPESSRAVSQSISTPPNNNAGPSSRPYQNYQPGGSNLASPSMNGNAISGGNGYQTSGLSGMGNGQGPSYQVKREEDVLRPRGGAPDADELNDIKPKLEPNAAGLLPGDEIIDSDLDDSDDELRDDADEDGDVNADIVFCVYDKVQRVKNKWKTTFKDGMVHINGRDYLFAKCTGEFEW